MVYTGGEVERVKTYTVSQLARMAGVSVRTLHHYDHIELLVPSSRSEAGYRLYGERDLLRLQQILFFRELDFPLGEIRAILDDPAFDPVEALESHRRLLQEQVERLTRLLATIDRTIDRLEERDMGLTDQELYEGFTDEQAERYTREARERYGADVVEATEKRLRKLSKAQWQGVKKEGEEIARALAELADRPAGDAEVQALIARHHRWIETFYDAPADLYRGLGEMYAENDEFRAFYDRFRPGLADQLKAAMAYYAEHNLA